VIEDGEPNVESTPLLGHSVAVGFFSGIVQAGAVMLGRTDTMVSVILEASVVVKSIVEQETTDVENDGCRELELGKARPAVPLFVSS